MAGNNYKAWAACNLQRNDTPRFKTFGTANSHVHKTPNINGRNNVQINEQVCSHNYL